VQAEQTRACTDAAFDAGDRYSANNDETSCRFNGAAGIRGSIAHSN
jgi:hypothetical protein